jgi:glutathione S-transferase
MKLYSGRISPNGKRVQICAAELGITLEPALVDFQKGENRSADYLALNPMGKVPTLVDDGLVLWESAAILWHLATQHDRGQLWPVDPRGQADALRWLFFGASHVDPHFTTLVVERFIKARRGLPADEHLAAAAERELARFLGVLDQQLAGRAFVTGRFGLPDITMGCAIELAPLVQYDLSPFAHLRGWLARLQARPSWQAAAAAQAPIAPPVAQ